MKNVKQVIEEILTRRKITNICFVGCGGSLVGFYPAYYYTTRQGKGLISNYITSNEFVYDTPEVIGESSIVVVASRRGNTSETVQAAKVAKKMGSIVIALTFLDESPLKNEADYHFQFTDVDPDPFITSKGAYGLLIAVELLHQLEIVPNYDLMIDGFKKMNEIIPRTRKAVVPEAIKFSLDYKNDNVIYTLGSGVAWAAGHQQAICLFMEMQWINSSVIHTGEFFHGPFEITDSNTAYLLFKSTGKTRALDERAEKFLNVYNNHLTIIDAMNYGADELGSVSEYFDAFFYNEVVDVYNQLLADVRQHSLDLRKYMWKYEY